MSGVEFFPDDTMVSRVPDLIRFKPCMVCGAREEFTVMGPAVPFFGPLPTACAKHVTEVRAIACGQEPPK